MKLHTFAGEQWLPCSAAEVFGFFADAGNLQAIMPGWLDFKILTPRPIRMFAGALIDYRLRVHGLPVRWQTGITVREPPHHFVDEQKRGPYRCWIHEHRFIEQQDGTLCTDHVQYAVPGGGLINRLFVRHDVERIFAFRRRKLEEIFGGCPNPEK